MPLPGPRTAAGRAGLAAVIREPRRALVGTDYDGTLAPIVPVPSEAVPAAGAVEALRALAGRVGTVAVITGRQAGVVVEMGGLAAVPGLIVAGQYGAERWVGGRLEVPEPAPGVATVRAELPALLSRFDPAVWVEDKALSVVVHTRRAANPDGTLAAVEEPVRRLAERSGLEAHLGRQVVEIRPIGVDKGRALRRLVEAAGAGAVLFAGDDLGDLPAFDMVEELRTVGVPGVTVASAAPEAAVVAARADVVVDGPAGLVTFFTALAAAL